MAEMTYSADDLDYMVDTGTFIECPNCHHSVTIDRMVRKGCWHCERDPWSFTVEV